MNSGEQQCVGRRYPCRESDVRLVLNIIPQRKGDQFTATEFDVLGVVRLTSEMGILLQRFCELSTGCDRCEDVVLLRVPFSGRRSVMSFRHHLVPRDDPHPVRDVDRRSTL